MEFRSVRQLEQVAKLHRQPPHPRLTQLERLNRWADVLEHNRNRYLAALPGTEYMWPRARDAMSWSNSPLSVAYEDPVLRQDGLAGESYGAARRYFRLSDREMHNIVCYCHYGATVLAQNVADRVRLTRERTAKLGRFEQMLARFRI